MNPDVSKIRREELTILQKKIKQHFKHFLSNLENFRQYVTDFVEADAADE